MEKVIACDVHDYFEAACMHRFILDVSLSNGQVFCGVALDLVTKDRKEYLILKHTSQCLQTNEPIKSTRNEELNTLVESNSELDVTNNVEINLSEIESVIVVTKNHLFSSFKVA